MGRRREEEGGKEEEGERRGEKEEGRKEEGRGEEGGRKERGEGDQYSTLQESLFTNPYSDRVAFCVSSVSHVNWPFTTDTASSSAGERASSSINMTLYAGKENMGHFNFLMCLCVCLCSQTLARALGSGHVSP